MKKLLGVCLLPLLLLLAACGGNDSAEATPTAAAPATVAATPTEEATVAEATPTEMTETTELTGTEGMTGTEEMTGTGDMTDTEEMTGTTGLTDSEGMTGTEELTGTSDLGRASGLTGTTEMSGTAGMTETAGMQQAPRQLLRASELQDYTVENAAGDNLGSVDDLVLNLENGQILLVTLQYGGFLDIGDKTFPVPLSAFRFDRETVEIPGASDVTDTTGITATDGLTDATDGVGSVGITDTAALTDGAGVTDTVVLDTRLILDIPEETFQNAPGIDEDMNLTDAVTVGEIETFYRDLGEDVIGRPIAETNVDDLTGRAVKLSDLDGANVQNPNGDNVGEINDMLLDLRAGRVEYFILSFGGFLGIGDNEYAIPVDAFDVIPTSADVENGQPTLVLDITEEQLETAPVFDDTTLDAADWDLDAQDFWLNR